MTHVKYKLKKPVVIDGQPTVEELSLRSEVVAGDLRGIAMREEPLADDMMKIIGRLAAQPDHVINRLSVPDFHELSGLVQDFINGGQRTGSEPSPS